MPKSNRAALPEALFPLQAFLNAWPDNEFLPMLRKMAVGIESTFNDVGWSWWGGEDEPPPTQGDLVFFVMDEEVKLSPTAFLPHLRDAADRWSRGKSELLTEVTQVVDEIERFFANR